MKKKILMCLCVLIFVIIIVLAVILCVKLNNNEKVGGNKEFDERIEIYTPNIYENLDEDTTKDSEEKIQLASTDAKKVEINKLLANDLVQSLINAKIMSTVYKGGNVIIDEFNSGTFTDEEKFKLLYSKLDFSNEVEIYSTTPKVWVKTEEIEKASLELFGESINMLNLKYLVIEDGKVGYTLPTNFGIQIFKIKTVTLDKNTNMYKVNFDMLKYSVNHVPYDILNYDEKDILATFELKVDKVNDRYVIKELNKI